MVKKFLNLIIAIIALAALTGIVYIVFFYDFTGKNIVSEEKKISSPPEETGGGGETMVLSSENQKGLSAGGKEMSQSEIAQENLKRMAASFAERFGSYSNHSNYSNISDLKIFMTGTMQAWADRFMEEIKAKQGSGDIYYGVTTKAVSAEVKVFDEGAGQAEILVKTQKREANETMDNASVAYQDILITFSKESGSWKVDKAEWQEQ
ncbi:MAG: hypothetical protein WC619_03770 [Patescibacteria group bacterium]